MKNHLHIPYFQTTRYRVQAMVDLAQTYIDKQKDTQIKMADLGSGDGRIVVAFTQAGFEAHGYETDKNLIAISESEIKKNHLESKAYIHATDFWQANLAEYSVITIYGMPDVMNDLEKKLWNDLPNGALVLSNYYPFRKKELMKKDSIYIYRVEKLNVD